MTMTMSLEDFTVCPGGLALVLECVNCWGNIWGRPDPSLATPLARLITAATQHAFECPGLGKEAA